MNSIATKYSDVIFRSRLEAKWAKLFDLLGWPWEYEPIDLDGYIPDFVLPLGGGAVLVEVKPEFTIEGLEKHGGKIEASGWKGEALICGARVPLLYPYADVFACLAERGNWERPMGWSWAGAHLKECAGHWGFCHAEQSYTCRVCGINDGSCGSDELVARRLTAYWREAGNATQWRSTT